MVTPVVSRGRPFPCPVASVSSRRGSGPAPPSVAPRRCVQASAGRAGVVTEEMLSDLPEPVSRYLTCTRPIGKPFARMVHLRQKGKMRPGPGGHGCLLTRRSTTPCSRPASSGTARCTWARVARARDMYPGGDGQMLVKVASLLPVVDAKGEEMDQGSMMRYLSEMIFSPAAFLGNSISFQAVDHGSAEVTPERPWPDRHRDHLPRRIGKAHRFCGHALPPSRRNARPRDLVDSGDGLRGVRGPEASGAW